MAGNAVILFSLWCRCRWGDASHRCGHHPRSFRDRMLVSDDRTYV